MSGSLGLIEETKLWSFWSTCSIYSGPKLVTRRSVYFKKKKRRNFFPSRECRFSTKESSPMVLLIGLTVVERGGSPCL